MVWDLRRVGEVEYLAINVIGYTWASTRDTSRWYALSTISKLTAKLDNKLTYNAAKSIMRKGVSCRTNGPEVCPLFHDGGGPWMAFRRSRSISIAGRSKHQAFTAMQVIDRSAKICVVDGGYTDQFRGVVCTGAPCDQSVISRGTVR